ncbi:MAG: hypothetical protein SNJ54_17480 [Anaerolineae bacterium]
MSSKTTKPSKPEDMLLRVIRVAEILVKSQAYATEESSARPPANPTVVGAIQTQKTQP